MYMKKHHSAEWCSLRGVRRAHALAFDFTLRSVPPVRKGQEHRDAAVSQQLLLSGRQGGSGAMSDFASWR